MDFSIIALYSALAKLRLLSAKQSSAHEGIKAICDILKDAEGSSDSVSLHIEQYVSVAASNATKISNILLELL